MAQKNLPKKAVCWIRIHFWIWIRIQVKSDVFIKYLAKFWVIYFFEVWKSVQWFKSYDFLHWIQFFWQKNLIFGTLGKFSNVTLIFRDGIGQKKLLFGKKVPNFEGL